MDTHAIGKTLWTMLLMTGLAYASLVILVYLLQDRMAYYPQIARDLRLDPRDFGLDHTSLTLNTATANGSTRGSSRPQALPRSQ